jgi:hypothetical protein
VKLAARNLIARERMNDFDGNLDERLSGNPGYYMGRQGWPSFGNLKTAVTCKSGQLYIFEPKRLRPAARRNVFQCHDLTSDDLKKRPQPTGRNAMEQDWHGACGGRRFRLR